MSYTIHVPGKGVIQRGLTAEDSVLGILGYDKYTYEIRDDDGHWRLFLAREISPTEITGGRTSRVSYDEAKKEIFRKIIEISRYTHIISVSCHSDNDYDDLKREWDTYEGDF